MDFNLALGMALHGLACLVIFFALVCGVVWIARFASKAQLKSWFWGLLVVGLLGCALTALAFGPSMYGMMDRGWDDEDSMDERMDDMDEMMDDMDDMMDVEEEEKGA